jgi:cytochrome c biogenesis protein CcdA
MTKKFMIVWGIFFCLCPILLAQPAVDRSKQPLVLRVFHMPTCKACVKTIDSVIPPIAEKYEDRVLWDYIDITEEENYKKYVALETQLNRSLATPTILIGSHVLVGMTEIADNLDMDIQQALAGPAAAPMALEGRGVDLLERFRSFGAWAVFGAGLVDGFNPCAFTVIVFFVSFLTLMGYKRKEVAVIGLTYIAAVYLTYLSLGFGLFKALYGLKAFLVVSQMIYLLIGGLSFFLGYLALRDYALYKKTGSTDALALQLPGPVKKKIHAIVGDYYRKDKKSQTRAMLGLAASAFTVGFLISLLEAVCTGQLYLPTIIFVLKDATLRAKALFYLVMYNFMFILPLVVVLILALFGTTSREFEAYAKKHLGLIKISMAAVFLALGCVLWIGLF